LFVLSLSNILLSRGAWPWLAAAVGLALAYLAWRALRSTVGRSAPLTAALVLRLLGIALVLFCLLEPQWVSPRAKRGANVVALLADNSQGLQVTETGESDSRGSHLRAALTAPAATWRGKLAQEFQVRSYVFDRTLRRVESFDALDFQGDRTSLLKALQEVRQRFSGQPLAGVILFTDGNATDTTGALPDLSGLPPVYPVVIGRPNSTRDVRIHRIDVRQTAFDDAPVSIRAQVSSQGMGAAPVDISLKPLPRVIPAAENQAGDAVLAQERLRLTPETSAAEATFNWRPTGTGIQFYELAAESAEGPAAAEATQLNNRRRILVDRGRSNYRILYVGGRPSWDYKFLNRAILEDPQLQMVGLLRVARREPKFEFKGRAGEAANPLFRGFGRGEDETARYDQPVLVRISARDENELRGGFPSTAEELFEYDAIIVDDMEASFFTHAQQELLRRFAADRGGGLLFLGGADSLENGGYANTPVASFIPLHLDRTASATPQGGLTWKLTREGWIEPWARVRPTESDERERLTRMPPFQVVHALESVKPGATTLAVTEDESGHAFPTLVAQRFGAGKSAALSIGDIWRWSLRGENEQTDSAKFWRQLARWLVTDTPSPVAVRVDRSEDTDQLTVRVVVRDRAFQPMDSAQVSITVQRVDSTPAPGPGTPFSVVTLPAEPVADRPGEFAASLVLRDAGAYLAEAEAKDSAGKVVGRAETGWVNDPAAEEFASLDPNRTLLGEISARTGGRVLQLSDLDGLADRLPSAPAPIMEPRSWPLWHQSWMLLLVLACFIAEWALRRWRGLP
jgi:uncharacterized membrane protein